MKQYLAIKVQTGDHVLLLGAFENEVPGLDLGMRRLIADGVLPKRYLLCGQELH